MGFFRRAVGALTAVSLFTQNAFVAEAVELDLEQPSSIKAAAKTIADDMIAYYATNSSGTILSGIPGLLTYPPYYWWEAGAMFGQMIEYWYYTNDSTYNDLVTAGLLFQVGPQANYMPPNQSKDEGNDDQLFWGFAVMSAAELNFPNPPADQPQWLALAQAIFNQMTQRWDTTLCSGGLPWQIYTFNNGYDYKNTASNGGFFQIAARLAKYTGNQTYADWANKVYDWLAASPLLTDQYQVYDGSNSLQNCTDADQMQWSYNYGILIGGAAYMFNYTNGSTIWQTRLTGLLNNSDVFFPSQYGGSVMVEVACELNQKCDTDQWSFKAYLARWMAVAAQIAPYTASSIMPKLAASAKAAAAQCNGGTSGTACGSRWFQSTSDGNTGVGQEMSALSVISANLIMEVASPKTAVTGGTSKGNPAAGTGNGETKNPLEGNPVTTGDRAGAGILTTLVLGGILGGAWFMIT